MIHTAINSNGVSKTDLAAGNALRSDAVTDILSKRPGFLVRWGVTVFCIMLAGMLLISWLIVYPDVVTTKATLASPNVAKNVICITEGKLVSIQVREGEPVQKGQLLGLMESIADHQHVMTLSRVLDSSIRYLQKEQIKNAADLLNAHFEQLGELQIHFQQFDAARKEFNDYFVNGFYQVKRRELEADRQVLQQMNTLSLQEKKMSDDDMALAEETLKMNRILLEQKVISRDEFREQQSRFLNKQQAASRMRSLLLSNETQQAGKRKELEQLDHDIAQQLSNFIQNVYTLKSAVDDWKKKYLLIAPVEGKVSFVSFLQENQQMKPGQPFCYINPGNADCYAEMYIPQHNLGKIEAGARVMLKFPSYPYQEFGSVAGKITFISPVPTDSGYLAKVELPAPLITNFHHTIQYRQGLQAEADIVTRPMRLLQRFYYSWAAMGK